MDLRIEVDHDRCLRTGNCAWSAPGRFEPDDDGQALIRLGPDVASPAGVARGLSPAEADAIREAAMFCPPEAISVWDAESGEQYFP